MVDPQDVTGIASSNQQSAEADRQDAQEKPSNGADQPEVALASGKLGTSDLVSESESFAAQTEEQKSPTESVNESTSEQSPATSSDPPPEPPADPPPEPPTEPPAEPTTAPVADVSPEQVTTSSVTDQTSVVSQSNVDVTAIPESVPESTATSAESPETATQASSEPPKDSTQEQNQAEVAQPPVESVANQPVENVQDSNQAQPQEQNLEQNQPQINQDQIQQQSPEQTQNQEQNQAESREQSQQQQVSGENVEEVAKPLEEPAKVAPETIPTTELTLNSTVEAKVEIVDNSTAKLPLVEPVIVPIVMSGLEMEKTNKSQNDYNYILDPETCNAETLLNVDQSSLSEAIDEMMKKLTSSKCNEKLDLRLQPATNKLIKGFVMEVSSMPIHVIQLIGSLRSRVLCSRQKVGDSASVNNLSLKVQLEMPDQRLRSRWRKYPALRADEIPIGIFGAAESSSNTQGKSQCQQFQLDQGDFYLELLSPRSTLALQLTLSQSGVGQPKVEQFGVDEMHLDSSLQVDSTSSGKSPLTVQVLHEGNNYYRRNNWLLDMYANWLKHEYKKQLGAFLGHSMVEQLNSCLQQELD